MPHLVFDFALKGLLEFKIRLPGIPSLKEKEPRLPTFLLGYNVEPCDRKPPCAIEDFLRAVSRLHRELRLPCTFFVCGRSLELHVDAFRRVQDECGDLIDFEQYTYAGLPIKTVCRQTHEGTQVFRGLTAEQCADSVSRTARLMEQHLSVKPIGLSAPMGYYRGLSDRPEILEVLEKEGIRFVRSYARNAQDSSPLAFEVQPFVYEAQGFPDILEIPGQGWPDALLRATLGFENLQPYVAHVKKDLDYVCAKDLVWSYVQYAWSSVLDDPEMTATRAILTYAAEQGFEMLTHRDYWKRIREPDASETVSSTGEQESTPPSFAQFDEPVENRSCSCRRRWRPRRMFLKSKCARKRRKPLLRRLMRKAGSRTRFRLLMDLSE